MKSLMRTRTRNRVGRFIPRCEVLEPRWCLSTTVAADDGELSIVGDMAANAIAVTAAADGSVAVTADGQSFTFTGIDEIDVVARGGGDTVEVDLSALTISDSLDIELRGGRGDDTMTLTLGDVTGGEVDVALHGAQGSDTLSATVGNVSGGELNISVNGGVIADSVDLTIDGIMSDSDVEANVNGGAGLDELVATLGDIAASEVNVDVDGGAHGDSMEVILGAITGDSSVEAEVDGGHGFDTLAVTFGNLTASELSLHVDGGSQNDIVDIVFSTIGGDSDLEAEIEGDAGADMLSLTFGDITDGEVNVDLNGGSQNDTLELVFAAIGGDVEAEIDGESGFDTCVAPVFVEVEDCEA